MRLVTISQFIVENPSFTNGGMRHLVFHASNNGLNDHKAIVRIGRKVMIDIDRFFEWVEAQNSVEA